MMIRVGVLLTIFTAQNAVAAEFIDTQLSKDHHTLLISTSDGREIKAPLAGSEYTDVGGGQDAFEDPQISNDGKYVGWLAAYPGGASYSQPLHLTIMDQTEHVHYFAGEWGMVFRWCFGQKPGEVVYTISFPHGVTPTDFVLSRIDDEQVLAEYLIPEADPVRAKSIATAPEWIRCISDWDRE